MCNISDVPFLFDVFDVFGVSGTFGFGAYGVSGTFGAFLLVGTKLIGLPGIELIASSVMPGFVTSGSGAFLKFESTPPPDWSGPPWS
eukprot:11776532-Ditylum_brightwellii.AAC.1